ncbi:MAG: DUF2066 domain-containing protein [Alteromonadaceae bacterium]|nr:DUF2066 domain-containing protein [Alteromonadaceae bacterium]
MVVFSANAVEVTDLYQAKVAVVSQAKNDRNQAIKNAMQAVLLKVGGQKSVLTNKTIEQGLKNYQQYLVQFSYQNKNKQRLLTALFNEEKINRLFHQADLPLWGNLRPQILLWLVQEQGFARRVIAESSSTEFPQVIQRFSQQRGLPMSLPLMDLTDLNALTTADTWGRFKEPIAAASARYHAEAFVVIRLSNSTLLDFTEVTKKSKNNESKAISLLAQNEDDSTYLSASKSDIGIGMKEGLNKLSCILCRKNNFALDWRLFTQSEQVAQSSVSQKYQGHDSKLLLQQALADITQEIYQYYALNVSDNRELDIDVANINTLKRYVDVSQFLTNLSSVDSIKLIWAQGEKRRFRLTLVGSPKALLASLKLNKQLQQYVDPLAEIDEQAIPIFYWQR